MLMRVTSPRKVKYSIELLTELFVAAGLENKNLNVEIEPIAPKTRKMLIAEGLIKTNLHPDDVTDTPLPVPAAVEETLPEITDTDSAIDDMLPDITAESDSAVPIYGNGPKLDYSFEAKLTLAPAETKDFYREVSDFARSYGVKVARSWARERVYLGRNLFALLTFKGKKLAIALALDPATHGDPKYHAFDMSASRKYARTPMLMRITSPRKVKYTIELLTELFVAAGLENKNLSVKPIKIPTKTKKALLAAGLIRIENE